MTFSILLASHALAWESKELRLFARSLDLQGHLPAWTLVVSAAGVLHERWCARAGEYLNSSWME